jgi:hypothetical protein
MFAYYVYALEGQRLRYITLDLAQPEWTMQLQACLAKKE